MAKMVSLAMSKKEAKAEFGGSPSVKGEEENLPKYPYGTSLRLDTETLKKLGIDLSAYPPGTECKIEAAGVVTDTSQSQRLNGKERNSLEIQVTEMAIDESPASKKKKADDAHLSSITAPADEEAGDY